MSNPNDADLKLEIAHVLLIDVVGYSKLLVNEQIELLQELNRIVRESVHFRAADAQGKLTRLPTGDGMALLFFDSAETPLHCALEITQALKAYPQMRLRMGAHSGPIKEITDVNDRSNFAGAGINLAQRVLDCGDAGHILVSDRIAEDLRSYRHWHACLHDLGECEVKHGVRMHLYNLCKDDLGNPALPETIKCQRGRWLRLRNSTTRWLAGSVRRKAAVGAVFIAVLALAVAAGWFGFPRTGSTGERGIAVLPFANSSDDSSNAYFVEGVQDEILTDLSKVANLKVISRASVVQFKAGAGRDIRAIARSLRVSHILEGSVQKVNDRVRVHAQLMDGATGLQLWANHYDGVLADVFEIQSQIATRLVAQLQLQLSPEVQAEIAKPPTKDFAAYDLYVRAKGLIYGSIFSARAKEELLDAVQLLTKAVERDPEFFLGYYQLAQAHDLLYNRFDPSPARRALAQTAIQTLRQLRPESGETHLALARHHAWVEHDNEAARSELENAQRKLPNELEIPLAIGQLDRRAGHWEDSIRNLHRALELHPQNAFAFVQIALSNLQLRRFAEMAAMLDRAIALEPNNLVMRALRAEAESEGRAETGPLHSLIETTVREDPAGVANIADYWMEMAIYERDGRSATRALNFLGEDGCKVERIPFPRSWCEGMAARIRGDEEAARAAFLKTRAEAENLVREQPDDGGAACVLGLANAALGNKDEAISNGLRAVKLWPIDKDALNGPLVVGYLAAIYAWVGEKDLALAHLEEVTKIPSFWSYGNLRMHPFWDPLRGDPRFEKIVQSLAPK